LKSGIPIVVGATDTAAELVSVGANRAGASLAKIASTGTVVAVTDRPVIDTRLLTYPHAVPGLWYTLGATNAAAFAYEWLRGVLFPAVGGGPPIDFAALDRIAARVPAGSGGLLFLPFLQGERTPYWDSNLRAAFLGLSSGHGPEHLARAVLEGVAFALRDCRDTLDAAGLAARRPRLAGGGTTSVLWRKILVSTLGETGWRVDPQGPAVGAAVLAAAAGADTAAQILTLVPRSGSREVRPVARWRTRYDSLYATYKSAVDELAGVSHDLAAIAATPKGVPQ
jgi:xylulokinase